MSSEYTDVVKKATLELFSTMMGIDLSDGGIVENRNDMESVIIITGHIGLAGDYKGNISIHFTKGMALKSISAMLGMEFDELTDDTKDAIGEIANIVTGGVKTELSKSNINFDLSLPTVISGENYSMFHTGEDENKGVIIRFDYDGESMFVEFDIKKAE